VTTDELAAALRACAAGIYPLEAGVALLISNGTFLRRDDFTTRFIEHDISGGAPDGCHRLGGRHHRPQRRTRS
jgi:hypothetical protein